MWLHFFKSIKLRYCPALIVLFVTGVIQAQHQKDTISYSFNTRFNWGRGTYAPFLSTVNEYDRFSFAPNSLTVWSTIHKRIKNTRPFDYGFGVEVDANISKSGNRFFAGELYFQAKLFFLNIYAGSKKEIFGNQDAELSSGGMLWSQNSRPMPKVSIESNGYVGIPFTKGYLEVKAGLSHGWFNDNIEIRKLLLHHKYASIRLGGRFPVNINYGLQHVVQWGGVSEKYGSMHVSWNNYTRVFLGKSGDASANISDQINTLGNHIISQNLGLDFNLTSVNISAYWQNITEDPPFTFMNPTYQAYNYEDGLWGISVRIPVFKPLYAFVLEYLSTTDQSGPWHDMDGVIYGGADGYYRNFLIPAGWSYRGMTMGNPWLTSPKYNKNGAVSILNNLVRLYYFSGQGAVNSVNYRLTLAWSENFDGKNPSDEQCKKQFSYQLEVKAPVNLLKNTYVSLGISGDKGEMYGDNFSFLLGISYSGIVGF